MSQAKSRVTSRLWTPQLPCGKCKNPLGYTPARFLFVFLNRIEIKRNGEWAARTDFPIYENQKYQQNAAISYDFSFNIIIIIMIRKFAIKVNEIPIWKFCYLSVLGPHILKAMKNQRGEEPLEIENFLFFLGVMKRIGWGQEPSKTLLRLFYQQKEKFCGPKTDKYRNSRSAKFVLYSLNRKIHCLKVIELIWRMKFIGKSHKIHCFENHNNINKIALKNSK